MFVTKRNGNIEPVKFDKITERISKLINKGEEKYLNPVLVAQKVVGSIFEGITTEELDLESANICVNLSTSNYLYSFLAGRILISNLHKKLTDNDELIGIKKKSESEKYCFSSENNFIDKENLIQKKLNLLDDKWLLWINENKDEINKMIDYNRDYLFDYFGFKTLERSYLIKIGNKIIETPQDMFMRVASFINQYDLKAIKKTYDLMSFGYYTHASPTLFNSGNKRSQLASCFEGNTLVNTLRGPIPIKDVQIGDEVITHLGNAKKVIQKHINKIDNREIYSVNIKNTNNFIVTGNHKLFTFNKNTNKTCWKEVRLLDTCDYIMIPKYKGSITAPIIDVDDIIKTCDIPINKIGRTGDNKQIYISTSSKYNLLTSEDICSKSIPLNTIIPIDNEVIKFMGVWFGCGYIIYDIKDEIKSIKGIGIIINKNNKNLIDFCIQIKDNFGIDYVSIQPYKTENIQIIYNCSVLGIIFDKLFNNTHNEKIIPDEFFKYDTKLIIEFLSGIITTDICNYINSIISLHTNNKKLIDQIYCLCRLHNYDVGKVNFITINDIIKYHTISLTILHNDLSNIWKTDNNGYTSEINKNYQSLPIIDNEGFKYLQFLSRKKVTLLDNYVYTLGVQDDHSYSIEGIIAQNCYLLGTDDSLEGITKTWTDVSKISKWGGGIGLHISNIRAKDSLIKGTNGPSSGIIPMLKVYNEIARYIDQCFVGKTKIYTNKGLIPIEQIKSNDQVFTLDGSLQLVERVYCDKYEGKILNFKIKHDYENIKVTDPHPFYVIKNQSFESSNTIIKNRLDNKLIYPEWISAKDITENDLIGFSIPKYVCDNNNLDESDCYMYGLMLCSGFNCTINNQWGISIEFLNNNNLDFIITYLKKNGIEYLLSHDIEDKITWIINSKFKFVRSQLYDINNNKTFDSSILNLPNNKLGWVLHAIIDIYDNEILAIHDNEILDIPLSKEIILKISSNNIIDGIKYILLKHGILCIGYFENVTNKYILNIPRIFTGLNLPYPSLYEDELTFFRYNDILYTRLISVTEEDISTCVYDLEIQNNHNYLTQSGLVHNGGKRKGSIAIYLEPHHPDIMAFLELRKNFGAETERARDLFTAIWVSDLFMKQVDLDGDWYLLCPDTCSGLTDAYGEEYEKLYWSYVNAGKYKIKVKAQDVMQSILNSQLETGTPYISFKDHVNRKTNQKNIGTIKSSNLCNEIVQYSDQDEYAVCNLASIALNKCVEKKHISKSSIWTIYTKDDCKYCDWSKKYLEINNYNVIIKNNNLEENIIEIKHKLGVDTFTYPQIFLGDEYIGGWDNLFQFTKGYYNYDKLYEIAYSATKNLNFIIDLNYYPVIETKKSNIKHRPIGLGIQGLADTLVLLKIPFDSEEAIEFNSKMMETIYLAAMTASKDLSKEREEDMASLISVYNTGIYFPDYYDINYNLPNKVLTLNSNLNNIYHKIKPCCFELINKVTTWCGAYSTFEGSPISTGKFQFDLWLDPNNQILKDSLLIKFHYQEKWDRLREEIVIYGVRNSLVTALMPTASTSQILGNNECFEFFTNNIYTRRTLAGDFPLVNKYLIDDLINIGLWTNEMKQLILANNGSIANFKDIPEQIRRLYQTIWEIKQLWVLKAAVARGPFNDQSQSMNIFMGSPNYQKLYSSHMWSWKNGLKTGIYYLRSRASKDATKVTIDPSIESKLKIMIQTDNYDVCENCSA